MYEQLISTSQKQFLLNVLLKYLPLYVLVVNSDEYIVNFHQTNCGEVVDQILKIDFNNETSVVTSVDGEVEKKSKLSVYRKRGQSSVVSKFPQIPEVITDFLKIDGFKAQEKRRDDNFRSCRVSPEDIKNYLLKKIPGLAEHGISPNTIRYMFVPVNKRHSSAARYKGLVQCKVSKKENSGINENEVNHFVHSRVGLRMEHANKYNPNYTIISADAMNKIHVGKLAVSG